MLSIVTLKRQNDQDLGFRYSVHYVAYIIVNLL